MAPLALCMTRPGLLQFMADGDGIRTLDESPAFANAAAVEFKRETRSATPPGVWRPCSLLSSGLSTLCSSLPTTSSKGRHTRVSGGVLRPDEDERNCGEGGETEAATAAAAANKDRMSSSSSSPKGDASIEGLMEERLRSLVKRMRLFAWDGVDVVVDKEAEWIDKCEVRCVFITWPGGINVSNGEERANCVEKCTERLFEQSPDEVQGMPLSLTFLVDGV